MKRKYLSILSAAVFGIATISFTPTLRAQSAMSTAQPTPSQVVDHLLNAVEGEFVPLADAMPADKFNFAPTNGNFKGVRTYAEQVKHVTMANYYFFSAASGLHANMPKPADLKTKAQIMDALKDSFVFAHRAVATLNEHNAREKIHPVDGVDTRAGLMVFALIHMNDHFGQMVVYLRMNGIVPPESRPRKK